MAVRGLRTTLVAVLGTCFFVAIPVAAQAAPGDLDPTFGTGGKVITSIGTGDDGPKAVAVTGCGTNGAGQKLYCPTADVPRQQMAAFLIRAFAP